MPGGSGSEGLSPRAVGLLNRKLVFDLVRSHGPLSRAKIAELSGLSNTAVVTIVAELVSGGLIDAAGLGGSAGGRRPGLVQAASQGHLCIGFHLDSNTLRGVLSAPDGTVIAEDLRASESTLGRDHVLEVMTAAWDELRGAVPKDSRVSGFGVALSASVGPDGVVVPYDMPGWADAPPLAQSLGRAWGVPGVVDNDANMGALAERHLGLGSSSQTLVYLLVDRGVGSGIVIDGDLYRGRFGRAGELGHIAVHPGGERCDCGRYGCFETVVSVRRLVEYAEEAIRFGVPSKLDAAGAASVSAIVEAARDQDPAALRAVARLAEWLGVGFATVVSLFDPEHVILGGPLANGGSVVLETAVPIARERLLPELRENVSFEVSRLGASGPALGASVIALDQVLVSAARPVNDRPTSDRGRPDVAAHGL